MSINGQPNRIPNLNWESWISATAVHALTPEPGLTAAEVGLPAAGEANHKNILAMEWESWAAPAAANGRIVQAKGLTQAEVSVSAEARRSSPVAEMMTTPEPQPTVRARAQAA